MKTYAYADGEPFGGFDPSYDPWYYDYAEGAITYGGTVSVTEPEWIYLNFTHNGYLHAWNYSTWGETDAAFAESSFTVNIGPVTIESMAHVGGNPWEFPVWYSGGYDYYLSVSFGGDTYYFDAEAGDFGDLGEPTAEYSEYNLDVWFAVYAVPGVYNFDYSLTSSAEASVDVINYVPLDPNEYLYTHPYASSNFMYSGSLFFTDDAGGNEIVAFFSPEPIPEPTTMLLLGSGLIGLAGARRKFRKS